MILHQIAAGLLMLVISIGLFYFGEVGYTRGNTHYHSSQFSTGGLIGVLFALYWLGAIIWGGVSNLVSPRPSATATFRPTATMDIIPQLTQTAAARNPLADCLTSDEVTSALIGRQICVWGLVYSTRMVGESTTQVFLSANRAGFFLASGTYWYPVHPGDCVVARGIVSRSGEGHPYINIDEALYKCP